MLVDVGLLGPVELLSGGRPLVVGSAQRQLVLAALAVDAGRAVPMETLIDRVWGERPPAQVRAAVYTRISHLRGVLAGADCQLALTPGGYLLRIDPDRVDLVRFRGLVAGAHRHDRSDPDRLGLLEQALGLWRGEPLAGLSGDWVEQVRRGWELERLDAALDWGRAALRTGQPAQVIPGLRQLTDRHPHSEPLAVLLVRALAGEGRVAEAAEVCQAVSRRLVADLGVQPGHQLRSVQQALLGGRPLPQLAPPAPAVVPPAAPAVVPAQLPGDIPAFAGRSEHLARLDALLSTATAAAPTAVVITAVSGTAGVGKTALAVHWAHQIAGRFPDGQLYVNLRGFHPTGQVVDPAAAVRGFLDALGVPAQRIPADPDAQTGLYRSLLAGRRVLVMLDNARDADHARPLLPGAPTTLAVVTSRDALTDLTADGAHPLPLDLLTGTEARELLERRLGSTRVAAEPAAVDQIITACARLPLALALVAARAASHPSFRLAALAGELATSSQSVPESRDVIGQVRAVFSWSYRALGPDAARLFRLLGLHPGPDTSAPAAGQPRRHPRPYGPRAAGRPGPRRPARRTDTGPVRLPRPAGRLRHPPGAHRRHRPGAGRGHRTAAGPLHPHRARRQPAPEPAA